MKEIILIKNGELALKGLNRSSFEDVLIKNMKRRLSSCGNFKFTKSQSTITITPSDEGADITEAFNRLKYVFGIAGLSRAAAAPKDINEIFRISGEYLSEQLSDVSTFKVEAKRSDKNFPLTSPQICSRLGEYLLDKFPHLTVDVNNPDIIVYVEIRDAYAYIHQNQIKGAGGMPVGTGGRAAVLISGGIDSPVAAWMMAKRGMELTAVHFASPPYTSERAEMKVVDLLKQVSKYSGRISLNIVPFTEIQEQIKEKCPEELFTIIMRRFMMKIAEKIAGNEDCSALITGESVGQVASQTVYALGCTDEATNMPVFRPCIGMDKDEIITISRKIETFDISIQPFEDCCTVFTPKHPRTRPKIEIVKDAESVLDAEKLIQNAMGGIRKSIVNNN